MILIICSILVYLIVPQEWVPIIRCDMMTQRKMKAQPPLSDAYLHGMPAKRRKVIRSALTSLLTYECHCLTSFKLWTCMFSDWTGQWKPPLHLWCSESSSQDSWGEAHDLCWATTGWSGEPGSEGGIRRTGDSSKLMCRGIASCKCVYRAAWRKFALYLWHLCVPQVKADIKKRVREDPDFNSQQFPNAHRAFSSDS